MDKKNEIDCHVFMMSYLGILRIYCSLFNVLCWANIDWQLIQEEFTDTHCHLWKSTGLCLCICSLLTAYVCKTFEETAKSWSFLRNERDHSNAFIFYLVLLWLGYLIWKITDTHDPEPRGLKLFILMQVVKHMKTCYQSNTNDS